MDRIELLFAAGRLFSPLYGAAMQLRSSLYQKGILKSSNVAAPVFSVGNLTWGGTGKTPLVIEIARFAKKQGLKPAVVSRGYHGSASQPVNVVSDGESLLLGAVEAGDEPRFLAEALPGVPVLTGKKRVLPARYAVESLGADLILLDDGFQHLALERQLDIVLFKNDSPLGNGKVFPAGPLREPMDMLARADCFVITGCAPARSDPAAVQFAAELLQRFPGRQIYYSSYIIDRVLLTEGSETEAAPSVLADKRIFAFCGIGSPASFQNSLLQLGIATKGIKVFRDHHRYCQVDIDAIVDECARMHCDTVLTTEKDYVKVRHLRWTVPLAVARGRSIVDESFFAFLLERYSDLCKKQNFGKQ